MEWIDLALAVALAGCCTYGINCILAMRAEARHHRLCIDAVRRATRAGGCDAEEE